LRRYPKRTWQGRGGAAEDLPSYDDPGAELLRRLAEAPGGRLHKLEVHQLAREVGLDRAALAKLYTTDPPLLTTEQQDRVITAAARERLAKRVQ
jgi:hypothetical protein